MTHDQALRKAKKLWGERATVDLNTLYELCCAVGVMSVPQPGDHSRFVLKGIARDWETCFKAAELDERAKEEQPKASKVTAVPHVTCQKCYLSQSDHGQEKCIHCDATLYGPGAPTVVSPSRSS